MGEYSDVLKPISLRLTHLTLLQKRRWSLAKILFILVSAPLLQSYGVFSLQLR